MEKSNFWNDACRGGAIVGAVMALSNVAEQALFMKGGVTAMGLMVLEWFILAGVFIWLLVHFTRRRASLYSPEEGFSYGQGVGFAFVLSLLAGVIVGFVDYLFRHVLIGYDAYIERYIQSIQGVLSEVNVSGPMIDGYEQMFDQLRSTPEPSIFRAVMGSIILYAVVGGLISLIVGAIVARAPKPFAEGTDQ